MPARVVIEVGTHSAWVQEIIAGCGHEVLVANRRLMEGSKRRKRKNNRNRCQQTGPVGSSGFAVVAPDQAPSREVRQDLGLSSSCCLPAFQRRRRPDCIFSQPDTHPAYPQSRFVGSPTVATQDSRPSGSLLLTSETLSFSASCRFIAAH